MARKAGVPLAAPVELDDGLESAVLTNSPLFAVMPVPPVAPISPIDLRGKPKLVCVVGAGGMGKTLCCRIIAERSLDREGSNLVTVDPLNRELLRFFAEALEPESRDRDVIDAFLDRYIASLLASPGNAVIDFGGGDTALAGLVQRMPNLEQRLADAGIALVVLFPVGGRQDDLTLMADLGAMGFRPKCTAVVLNHIRYKRGESHEAQFRMTLRHPAYRAAIDHGAVPIWLPHLASDALVRDRHILFADAIAGRMPEGKKGLPLGPAQSADVGKWWDAMLAAIAPIDRWLP
jgi:hypothetical protein